MHRHGSEEGLANEPNVCVKGVGALAADDLLCGLMLLSSCFPVWDPCACSLCLHDYVLVGGYDYVKLWPVGGDPFLPRGGFLALAACACMIMSCRWMFMPSTYRK